MEYTYKNNVKYDIDRFREIPNYVVDDVKDVISTIEHSVKCFLKESPDADIETIEFKIHNLLNAFLYSTSHPTRSDLYLYKSITEVVKNPNIIRDILSSSKSEEIINNTQNKFVYSSNIKENYINLLKDALNDLKKNFTEEYKQKIISNKLSESEMKLLQNDIVKFLKGFNEKFYNKIIKDGYIKKIVNYAHILDFTGILPRNNNYNTKRFSALKLDFLCFNYNSDTPDDLKRPAMEDLLNPEFYKSFSLDELVAMSAFYSNRVGKAIENYNNCLYIINKTELLKKCKENPDYEFNLSNSDIKNILLQQKLFEKSARDFIQEQIEQHKFDEVKITPDTIYEELENPIIKQCLRKYEIYYSDEFNEILPDFKHDILSDFGESILLQTSTMYAYNNKYHSLESLLLFLIDKDKERNWGVILDETYNEKLSMDSINSLLIGVDMKEFNMPVSFHCSEEEVHKFIKNYTGTNLIPVYKGNKDLLRTTDKTETFYTTQVFMKLSKEQRKILRQTAETMNKHDWSYKLIQHIQWMSHPNRPPEHIKKEYGTDKNGNLKKYFYDFEKKKIYTEKYLIEQKER